MKEGIKWNVPEGWEIDKEKSNDKQIVFKKIEDKRANSWKEYCDMKKGKDSYVVDMYGNVRTTTFSDAPVVGEFDNKEEARVFAAFSRLIKLRKNWVGDWKPDWTNDESKYTIINEGNSFVSSLNVADSCPMSFPTEEMRDKFAETFTDLLVIAKPFL